MNKTKHYRNFDIDDDDGILYSEQYGEHVSAMTGESLHSKSDIALELAVRDIRIKELESELMIAKSALANINPETASQRQVLSSYRMLVDNLDKR